MEEPQIPQNEDQRLESLHELGLLDTKPEERFDRITQAAALIFDVPISTLTLIDANREWFKSVCGLDNKEGDRAESFCGHALNIEKKDILVIPDTHEDKRFSDNPNVIGPPYIRFYAGVPVKSADDQEVGVFCIKSTKPRSFSEEEEQILKSLSAWAELEINSHNTNYLVSKIKNSEKNIEQSYRELHIKNKALDALSQGVSIADAKSDDSPLVYVNEEFENLTGYSAEEILGKNCRFLQGEDTDLQTVESIRRDLEAGKLSEVTLLNYTKNNHSFWNKLSITPVFDDKQDLTHFVGIQQDVTQDITQLEQKKLLIHVAQLFDGQIEKSNEEEMVNHALRKIGEQFRVSRIYIFEDNQDDNSTSNTFEWTAEGISPQKDMLQNVPYEHLPSVGKIFKEEGKIVADDIKDLPTDLYEILNEQDIKSIILIPIMDGDTRIGFIGYDQCDYSREWTELEISDINIIANIVSSFYTRKRYENRIQENKNRIEYILKGTNLGTWEWNVQTGEVIFNERWAEIIGYTREELEPITIDTWKEYSHPEDFKKSGEKLKEHFAGKTDYYECRARMKHKDDYWVWVLDRGKVFTWTEDGEPEWVYGTHEDITEQVEVEQSKSELISLAAHQLKTPIGAINWNVEMLLDGDYGDISDMQKDVLQETYTMSTRMNDIVELLLNVSRIEIGVFAIDPSLTNFAKLCDEVLAELESLRKEKDHEITKEFEQNLPQVSADPKLLRIIFQNLLSNAIKYTQDEGKIQVSLKTDNDNIIFSVANNGDPIPEEEKEQIFSKLFRASNARKQEVDGNGLGLYVTKQIVERAGGEIWFTSQKGEDTVFTCSFPLIGMKEKAGRKKLT